MTDITVPGLNYAPHLYDSLLEEKRLRIIDKLRLFNAPSPHIFSSPKTHFRMRAEFRIWHLRDGENEECFYAMFERDKPKQPVRIESFPIASKAITQLMPPLMQHINKTILLKKKLFQLEFLSTTTGEVLVSLIYHRQLDNNWLKKAAELEEEFNIAVIGRARKQRIVVSKDFVVEKLTINQNVFHYQQKENSFTQPNAAINQQMISWVDNCLTVNKKASGKANGDLIELYCGNGNFTIPLAQHFNRVLATEVSKTGIYSAQENCQINKVSNIDFVRLSSAEAASALSFEREFRRLKHIDLNEFNFTTVLVDPPRAGLDEETLQLVSGFESIIYISCNPDSLVQNLKLLSISHGIQHLALFDQFPYTDHCECGVILHKRKAPSES